MAGLVGDRVQRDHMVATTQALVDLTATPGDVVLTMVVPGDKARLIDVSYTIQTAGVGSFNHELTLEAGTGAAGVAIAKETDLLADGAVGLTVKGEPDLTGETGLTRGTELQIKNTESGSITTGAIINVVCLWQM